MNESSRESAGPPGAHQPGVGLEDGTVTLTLTTPTTGGLTDADFELAARMTPGSAVADAVAALPGVIRVVCATASGRDRSGSMSICSRTGV